MVAIIVIEPWRNISCNKVGSWKPPESGVDIGANDHQLLDSSSRCEMRIQVIWDIIQ
jgi:hypothetical protein